ncbi:MAG: O-antigen ligase family protein [Crocinitomicaceae bacterium]
MKVTVIVQQAFFWLLSLAPLMIILGNIVPPIPIKVHFISMGLIFLCALYLLMDYKHRASVFILGSILVVTQFVLNFWDIKNIIDFLFGPLVLVVMFDQLINKKIPKEELLKHQKRFYYLLLVPVSIGILQFFELLPITFWNAQYINFSYKDGIGIPRPNGLLYHGSELCIIIFFLAAMQFFSTKRSRYLVFAFLLFAAFSTYFKAILGGMAGLLILFIIFNVKPIFNIAKRLSNMVILLLVSIGALVGLSAILFLLNQTYQQTGYPFHPQFLTGRGEVWNIYLDGIKEFSVLNYLFGNGIGSGPELFKTYASPQNYYRLTLGEPLKEFYTPHNAVLGIFINSGVFGLVSISTLFYYIFRNITTWGIDFTRKNKHLAIAIMGVLLLTIGITIVVFDMAIIWICMGFLLIKWKYFLDDQVAN